MWLRYKIIVHITPIVYLPPDAFLFQISATATAIPNPNVEKYSSKDSNVLSVEPIVPSRRINYSKPATRLEHKDVTHARDGWSEKRKFNSVATG